ncbi:hypothetical protein GW17_00024040 [Ensete ventricosum]|nr:hypothetical protein GW17_00024040 [Ensete ventricosum]
MLQIFCRGSKNDTRGFRCLRLTNEGDSLTYSFSSCCSCGLWVLFHSLSVRVGDGESQSVFTAICDFIQNFFVCDDCRRHFREMSSSAFSVSVPFNTTRELSMWLWRAHNKVNERLNKEEKALGTGDPRFPKIIWPSKQLCRSCYVSSGRKRRGNMRIDWNEDEVYKFLVRYYGRTLASSHNDATLSGKYDETYDITTSTNAVAVPIGAALAIAVASCTFGALACFWRAQQKNRKYTHQLHSFKDI